MSDAEICKPTGVVGTRWQVPGDVRHPIVDALVPAQRDQRNQVTETGHSAVDVQWSRDAQGADGGRERAVERSLGAADRHEHARRQLSAENFLVEDVGWNKKNEI